MSCTNLASDDEVMIFYEANNPQAMEESVVVTKYWNIGISGIDLAEVGDGGSNAVPHQHDINDAFIHPRIS